MIRARALAPSSQASRRAVVVAVLTVSSTGMLAGCTTTQERSAIMSSQAAKAAKAKQFKVGRTNKAVKAQAVKRLEGGGGAAAVVVRIVNRTKETQALVPIGVDLWDAKKVSLYSNRIDGLDAALNNLPVVPPGVSYWVNNQLPQTKPARMQVRVGTSLAPAPADLPEIKVAKVKVGEDAGIATATGVVRNLSAVEQKRLTIFAAATKGDEIVAGGRAVVERLAPKGGRGQRFKIYFTGDPRGATLHVTAPPSTFPGA